MQLAPVDAVVLEKGTRWWAAWQADRGKRIGHPDDSGHGDYAHGPRAILDHPYETGWAGLPAPWVPKQDEEVRWFRGKHHGTGEFGEDLGESPHRFRYRVYVDNTAFFVERVERCEEEARDGK